MPTFTLERYGPKKRYYVFWSENGRSERRSTRTSELKVAEKWRDNFVRNLLTTQDSNPNDVELGVVLDTYQDEKGMGSPSEKSNRFAIAGFKKFYGDDLKVPELTLSRHIAYEKHCRKLGQMASTINKRRNVLIAALNHARKNGILASIPYVPILPTPPTKARHFERTEAARLLRAARKFGWKHLVMFIRIGMYTGARATAILQLTWDRVDLEKGRIDFRLPGEVETKKRRPNAPINDILLRALRALRKTTNKDHVILYRGRLPGGRHQERRAAHPVAHVHHVGASERCDAVPGIGPDRHERGYHP